MKREPKDRCALAASHLQLCAIALRRWPSLIMAHMTTPVALATLSVVLTLPRCLPAAICPSGHRPWMRRSARSVARQLPIADGRLTSPSRRRKGMSVGAKSWGETLSDAGSLGCVPGAETQVRDATWKSDDPQKRMWHRLCHGLTLTGTCHGMAHQAHSPSSVIAALRNPHWAQYQPPSRHNKAYCSQSATADGHRPRLDGKTG
jgi:hypothetical protein